MENERKLKGIWIPIEIWEDKELTMLQKAFLIEIVSLNDENWCCVKNSHFAERFKISKTRCSRVILALAKKGYVITKYTENDDGTKERIIKINKYKINGLVK